jgi:hypothetical protein
MNMAKDPFTAKLFLKTRQTQLNVFFTILERWDGVMWTGLVWLRIGTGGEFL